MASPPLRSEYAESAAEAVAEIMACADIAVESIGRQTAIKVGQLETAARDRPVEEALERRKRLALLRAELAEQAATLALSYAAVLEQLGDIDRMLVGESPGSDPAVFEEGDPRVASIKMTLRERTRIHGAEQLDGAPAADPPWVERQIGQGPAAADAWPPAAPVAQPQQPQSWPVEAAPDAAEPTPIAHVEPELPRRRPWRLWKRAA